MSGMSRYQWNLEHNHKDRLPDYAQNRLLPGPASLVALELTALRQCSKCESAVITLSQAGPRGVEADQPAERCER